MKLKGWILSLLFTFLLASSVYADEIEISTYDESNVTYYSATLNGHVTNGTGSVTSYGFKLWAPDLYNKEIVTGSPNENGDISCSVFLCEDTTYFYQAYVKDKTAAYHYGETKSFRTPKSDMLKTPEVDFNIDVESPEKIDFAQNPNKFFLNNLIVNNSDSLKLIAGNNFNGIDGVKQSGGKNIFINQYFIDKYNTDPVLRSLLTIFDGAIYNRDDFIWDTTTSILVPDFVASGIYNTSPDNMKSILNTIYGDMKVKRFNAAINNVLSNDYTSSDKRTFGYDKTNYKLINAFATSTNSTSELIKNYQDGKEKLLEGIEDYQGYYFGTIMPKYANVQNDLLKMNQYLLQNSKNMTPEKIVENLEYASEYSQQISAYENMDFAYETASKWKLEIETNYYAKEVSNILEKIGKPLSMASSSLGTLKTLNQVYNNKEQLQGTFERLSSTTDNKKLRTTIDDYIYKMNDRFGSFLSDTAANIYSTYAQKTVKKEVNAEIVKTAKKIVAGENNVYTNMVIDTALAKANYLLIAADAGGVFSEKISGTKTYLEKAIEAKYLWNIENESKRLLQIDLSVYEKSQTEENAEAVLNDLFWIKALKLREITVTKELYNANGGSWLALADKSLSEISDNVDELFKSQRDALINASLTETRYTSEPLTLENGETYFVMEHNDETDNNGALKDTSGTTMLQNADSRLAGGVNIKKGATLSISASSAKIYIPFITMESGAKLIITSGTVKIGELNKNSGSIVIAGDSVVDIIGNIALDSSMSLENAILHLHGNVNVSNNINIDNGELNVIGNVSHTEGNLNIGDGKLKIEGDYTGSKGTFDVGSGRVEIDGSFLVGKPYYASTALKMQNESAYMLVNGDFYIYSSAGSSSGEYLSAGKLEVKGDFTCYASNSYSGSRGVSSFVASGTHKTVLSGSDEQVVTFTENAFKHNRFNILKSTNSYVNFDTYTFINEIESDSVFNNLKLHSANFSQNANIEVKGNLYSCNVNSYYGSGSVNWGSAKVNVRGDLFLNGNNSIQTGELNIAGNVTHTAGDLNIGDGKLKIGGDYIGSKGSFDVGNGRVEIGESFLVGKSDYTSIALKMQNESAYMLVNGDFYIYSSGGSSSGEYLSAGTLELKGNFTCHEVKSYSGSTGVSSFVASGTHKVILSGSDEQIVSFAENGFGWNKFNILVNKNSKAVFKTKDYRYLINEISYVVKFVTNTGKGTITKILDSTEEHTVTQQLSELGTLEKEDNYLKGWYLDSDLTNEWNKENDAITSDMTLYAKWVEPIVVSEPIHKDDSISVNATLDYELVRQNGKVVIALYDRNDRLMSSYITDVAETISHSFSSISNSADGYTIRVFCLSDLGNNVPLCNVRVNVIN